MQHKGKMASIVHDVQLGGKNPFVDKPSSQSNQGLQTIYMREPVLVRSAERGQSKHTGFTQTAYLQSHVQGLIENPGFPRWQVHWGESFLHIVLVEPGVVTTATARTAWHSPCTVSAPSDTAHLPASPLQTPDIRHSTTENKGRINVQGLKGKGKQKHTCIHGDVCLCASWTCLQATCAEQFESASITSKLSIPFQSSTLENLPSSQFEFAGMSSNVIKGSTRKGLTGLSTTDSPYPGWQVYELCSATFILDIWTFLVYTHPFSCHSARILWIPLVHNSRSRLLNN